MTPRLQKLLELYGKDPSDAFIRYGIALEYSSMQRYSDALDWFEKLRTDIPDYLPTYYMLGGLYSKTGKIEQARAVYAQGIGVAQRANDFHTLSEIRAAVEELDEEV